MENNDYIDDQTLEDYIQTYSQEFQTKKPFSYVYIDNFIKTEFLDQILESFPSPTDIKFYQYENPLEKKLAMDKLDILPPPIKNILLWFNSPKVLNFLEKLTGIDGLVPDPYYRGGGIHQITKNGKLDIHIDFNVHPKLKLQRRLNLIVYLNKDWEESYGGHIEFWNGHKEGDTHILDTCIEKILPLFNRMAIFETSEISYHGHPEPLLCPSDRTRKSIALYYYTTDRPIEQKVSPHSTTFVKRPIDPNSKELDQLREKRNCGRFTK